MAHSNTGSEQQLSIANNAPSMHKKNSNSEPFPEHDYETIEAAVMETARGRWFLQEYAARHRHSNTNEVIEAIAALEQKINKESYTLPFEQNILLSDYQTQMNYAQLKHIVEKCLHSIETVNLQKITLKPFNKYNSKFSYLNDVLKIINEQILVNSEKLQEISFELENTISSGNIIKTKALCRAIQDTTTDIFLDCAANSKLLISVKILSEVVEFLNDSITNIASVPTESKKNLSILQDECNRELIAIKEPTQNIIEPNEGKITPVMETILTELNYEHQEDIVITDNSEIFNETEIFTIDDEPEITNEVPVKSNNITEFIEYHTLSFSEKYALFA